MTYQSTVRRLTGVTAILVAIGLTLFLTAPFGKGVSLAQASAENTPATGAPIIASPFWYPAEPRVTRELRALTFYIEDEDGMENVTFAYQWIANDGSTDTDIVGASGQEYTLQASDEGMTIKVRVSFTDDAGNSESRTSEPTVEVVAEDAGICTRTPIVIERIIWYADGVRDCGFVTDDHLADVTSLIFAGSQDEPRIDSFKAGDFAGLSNLTFLSIWGTDLTELPTGVFNGLSRLRELNMHTNRNLATLPSGIFDGLTLITELHMNHNAIAEFPPGVFEDLEVLRVLNLGGNELTTLPEGVFDNLTHLEELYIWDNGLTTLPEGIFDNLSDLERLSLNNNGLTSLRADLFPGLDKLKDLSFWNNNLDALPDDIFKDLDSLEVLSLSQNNFDALPDGLFSGSTSLVSVWLEDNPGSPFVFDLEVAREDDDTVVVNVSNATPLDISITLEAYGGSLSATEVTLLAGSTSTDAINATPDGDGAMTVRVVSADFEAEYATGIAVGRGGPLTLPNAQNDNNPAIGKPTISGTAQVGQTLTASKSDIADPDGVDNATFAYQWVSNDGSTDRDIADATSSTYTITASELGRTIKVLVTFADDGGNHEIATSAATEAVVAAPNIPATGKPVIVGDPIIPPYHSTEALTVDLSGISDQNGMSGAEFSYTWHCVGEDLDDRCPYGNSWEPTYQLSSTLQGHTIKVYVSFMDDGGNVETLLSEPVGPVAHPNSPARGAPLLRGTPIVGKRLSADSLGIHDGNGTQKHRFDRTYQWFADGTEIEGATGYGYTVSSDDVGKRIHFVLYFKDDDGWDEALESPPTALVVAADSENSPPRGAPQIRIRHSSESNGEAHYIEVGDTITTVTTTGYSGTNITDADGLTNAVFTYQWMRGDGTTYSDIPDATSMSYTLGDADEGKGLKVKVTFTDDAGNQHSMFSAPSSPVDPGPTPSNNNPAEGNAVISGTAKVGETLTVDVSGITDADGMEDASFGFTWTDGTYWLGIGYIDTWEVLPSYVGKQLTVHWNFYDDMGYHESGEVTSAVVVATVPEEPRAVAVEPGGTGELDVSWAEPDSDGGSEITSYTVQWKKAAGIWDADEDVPEATATSTTHTITGLELDVEYTVRIIATNSIGDGAASDEVTATTVAAKPNSPATGTPTINGTAQVGETLTADTTGIDDSDGLADVSYNYQWLADDTEIAGATGNAYVLTSAELGKAVRVRVSFTDDAGNEESLTSAATTAVAAAPPPPPDNVRAVTQNSGAVELTWEAPQDATVTGYRIERSRADENRGDQQRSIGIPRDNHTLVEDTGSADTGYTDKSAEQGVEYEYRVSARNEAGAGESSDWVRAGPESVSNSPATGAPTIRGTAQVGETLTADISGIADADGLDNVSFSYQWLSSRDTAISGATGETYTLVSTDFGKIIKVKVTFTDDAGNSETLTSAGTAAVVASANSAGICDRTAQVRETILDQLPDTSDCAAVTDTDLSGIIRLALSEMGITTLKSGDFSGLSNLRHLNLVDNELSALSDGIFDDLTGLQELSLFDNRISRLPDDIFDDLSELHSLHLNGNELSELPDGIFDNLTGLQELSLFDNRISRLPDDIFDDLSELHSLHLNGNELSELPDGIFDNLTQLQSLSLSGNGLSELPDDIFDNLTELQSLSLGDNSLSELPDGAFDNLTELQWLDLGNNDLSELPGGIFDNLTRLRTLKLSHNDLSELPDGIFDNLTELEILYLHWNGLSELPDGILDKVTALSSLELSYNELSELPDGLFDDLSELQFLHLSDNELSVLPDRAFDSLTKLWSLSVGGNELSALPEDVFVNLAKLQSLDLNSNELSELPDGIFDDLSELHSLHLNGNELSELPDGIFDNLTKLRTLSVDYNELSELPDSVFDNLSELWGLSLIGNELSELPDGIFDNLANLKQLYLFSNKLSELPDRIFYGLASLDVLNIDENTGSPFTFTVELERPDENTIALKVAQATPFDMEVTLSAEGGSLSSAKVLIPAGNVSSEQITVSPNGAEPVAISVVSAAFLLGEFQQTRGIQTGLGEHLTLGEDSDTDTPATGTPTISGTAQVGETLRADTADIADADGLTGATFRYQWLGSRDTEIQGATNVTYTLVADDEGKTIKVRVTFTDDGGNNETLTSAPTAVVSAALPPPPDNVRAVTQESGAVELTWEAPDDATVTGYRIERSRADENRGGQQRSDGRPRDNHTLVDDTGSAADTGYTDESAEKGVEYEYRVSARNESGPGEGSDWVRAGPASASNSPATGAPTISGTAQVGETLTADITGIADADGLSGEAFTYQWVSGDGTTDTDIEKATDSTYKLVAADKGNSIKVRVTFTDDGGNEETLTSAPTAPVWGDGLPGAPGNLTATPGNKEVTLSWDPPEDNGNAPATRYRIEWRVNGKDYDQNHWGTSRSTTYTTNDQANLANGVKYFFRVKAENDDGNSYGPYGPASGEVSATPTSGSAVDLGTPVLSDTETLHHGMVRLDWQDVEDAGWYVVQYYHVEGGEWLDLPAEGVDIAFHGSSAVVSNLHGLSWLRVRAMSCAGESEWSQIEQLFGTNKSDWEGVPVPDVEEGDEIEPCPVVLGTPVLSDTETLHHGIVRLDWQDIEDAGWYVVQYYHVKSGEWLDLPAEGVDIAFHGSSAVVSNLHGLSWLRVRAMSCAGESEWSQIEQLFGTNASDWKGVPVPDVAEGDEIEPCSEDADTSDNSPATGAPTISGTVQVGETLTADTSGIADADGLANATFSYQWITDDSVIVASAARTYTPTDGDRGKSVKVRVSFTDDAGNPETRTSANTATVEARANSPATGLPTISGTAQVGQTLTANTSGVADADRLSNVQYEYQWLANDSDISGATNATYTLADDDEGKAIKVRVNFTDDAGYNETLTSAGTAAVSAANTPATGAPTISGTAQVGETLTANTSGVADVDGLSNVQYEYRWIANDSDISGATNATYTLVAADEGKAIKVRVSFTDDAGNNETLTSAGTAAVSAANTPATGAPTIIGAAQVGEALTVDTSGIADAEGLTNVLFTYQWLADDADINGAIGFTYTMKEADEGKTIKVKVSFTDDADNEETLTSVATTGVAGAAPAISGGPSYITVEVTEDSSDPINIVTNFTITWSNDSFCSVGYNAYLTTRTGDETEGSQLHLGSAASDGAQITAGLTGVQGGVFGFDVELYCGTDESGRLVSRRFISTTNGRPWPHIYSSEPPLSALSVSHGTFIPTFNSYTSDYTIPDVANADTRITITAIPKTGYAVEFFESSGNGVSGLAVYSPGASGLSSDCNRSHFDALGPLIELTDADPNTAGFQVDLYDGENHVEVAVYPTEYCAAGRGTRSGYGLAITRAEGSISLIRPNRPPIGLPGTGWYQFNEGGPIVGYTKSAAVSHIRDRDGMANATFSYQWLADDAEITGAISSSYTVAIADLGKTLKVRVSFTDDRGTVETLTSRATKVVKLRNFNPTGKPIVLGTLEVGQTLRADVSGISDRNGMTNATFTYEWTRSYSYIAGASADFEEYTLVDRDAGRRMMLRVNYTDDAGHDERLYSELTGEVAPRPGGAVEDDIDLEPVDEHSSQYVDYITPEYPDPPADPGRLSIAMYHGVGSAVPVVNGLVPDSDPDTLDYVVSLRVVDDDDNPVANCNESGVGGSYLLYTIPEDRQWHRTVTFSELCMSGAGSATLMIELLNGSSEFMRRYEFRFLAVVDSPATGTPTISGTAQVGETLTADTSDIADANGLNNVQYEYQWLADDSDISGATNATYTLAAADEGKAIKVQITFTDDEGNAESLTSAATDAVAAGSIPNSPATGAPTISGTVQVAETLEADTSGIADADGLSSVQYEYQWLADDADISGATNATYTLADSEEGKAIKVEVSFTDDAGNGETLTSVATGAVAAEPTTNSPATGAPTISGTVQVWETLTANTSGIADDDGLNNVQYEYQWLADGAEIAGAIGSTYTLTAADEGKAMKLQVGFTDDEGNAETLTSAATAAVMAVPPSTTPGEPQNLELTPVAVGTNGVGIKVFWDAPSATGGSDISGYRIQWKGGSQDYPDDQETRQAFVENAPYTIDTTSPTPIEGDELTVRIAAVNGAGAGVWTEKVGWLPENNTDLELWLLMKEYADEKQTTFPWVLETWNYLDRYEVPVEVGPTPGFGSVIFLPCGSLYTNGDDGLKECHVEKFKILQIEDPKPRIIIHEMAHVYSLANRVTEAPGPLAIAHLYFDSLNLQGGLRGCEPRELYADVLTMLTLDIDESSYWETCNGDNAQREAQALDVLRSAVDGEMPQWFADTYTDAEDEPDLERLWTDVQDLPRIERNVAVYQLRDAFGGYCNNRLTWKSMQYSEDKLTQPWMDGGCPPPEPSSLEVTPGEGELTLAWDAPASDGDSDVEGYIVQWKSVYKSYDDWATRRWRAVLDSPTSLTYTISGLGNGIEYDVRVRAYNAIGPGQPLDVESVTTSEPAIPAIPENTRPTGVPTITGTAQVGEVLTVDTSGISDEDGMENASFTFNWGASGYVRATGAVTEYTIQTDDEYTIQPDDEGKRVYVVAFFKDDKGNWEVVYSALTSVVEARPNSPATGAPSISGTAQVGEALTADTSGIADADGLTNASFTYQWLADDTEIAGATGLTYTLTDSDEGKAIKVQVSFTDDAGNDETLTSAATDAVASAPTPNSPATDAPTISGSAQVGETLTADTSDIADADGLSNVQYEYQWLADDAEIADATNSTYTLADTDEGKAIKVRVSFTDDAGNEETLTSAATDAVAAEPQTNSPATGATTITGTVQVGETLTADTSDIADADGLSNVQYEYQWLADDAEISGATNATYTLADTDEGKAIKVEVTFTDDAGDEEALTSAATDAVSAEPTPNNPATGAPTISGTAQVEEMLTADTSGIADADGLSSVHYEYQWLADDAEISGATSSTYTVAAADEGKVIKVRVSFTDDAGNEETLTSAATDAVSAAPAANSPATGAPTISGTAQVGETLTANTSGVADADGLSSVQYEYQWLVDDSDISGATNATYTLAAADEGKAIKVQITFTDDAGNAETLTSAATDAVAAEPSEPPDKPKGLDATATHDAITLTWDDPQDDSITGYVILRRLRVNDQGGDFSVLVANTESAAATYTDNTVAASTTYTYRIKAINEHGVSERSRWVHIDTPAPPVPDQPTGLEATVSNGQVVLTWDDPDDESITGYVILRRVRVNDEGGDFSVLVADTGSAATTYTDDTVAAGTTYTYRIKAINEHGTSERSRWYHISTPAAP